VRKPRESDKEKVPFHSAEGLRVAPDFGAKRKKEENVFVGTFVAPLNAKAHCKLPNTNFSSIHN
jgi:hypothetical protein